MNSKIKILIMSIIFIILICVGVTVVVSEETVLLYNIENKTMSVSKNDVVHFEQIGWYTKPVVMMYAPDGRTQVTYVSEILTYQELGWYLSPVTMVYKPDGQEKCIYKSEQESYQSKGWYNSKEEALSHAVNQDDVMLLARIIHAEANPHNYTDKCYVGAVVMNRLDSGIWGDDLLSVITAPGQYTSYGSRAFNSTPPQDYIEIATALLQGERYGMPSNVIFQAGFIQGTGVWAVVDNGPGYYTHYYCY